VTRTVRLDDLLGPTEPFASFHDAALSVLHIDYEARSLVAEFELCVGDPDAADRTARERSRRGRLRLSGLILWAVEPPDLTGPPAVRRPWLTSDGPLDEAPTDAGKGLAGALASDIYCWYLYFSDLNAFAYCAAQDAQFEWL